MEILSVGSGVYVIHISEGELPEMEKGTEALTENDTKGLVCRVLGYAEGHTPMVIELYEGGGELLLFAAVDCGIGTYFSFENFEDVVGACVNSSCPVCSELYLYDEKYILAVSGEPENLLGFREFGEEIGCGGLYYLFLQEHGKTLISHDAVKFIKNVF